MFSIHRLCGAAIVAVCLPWTAAAQSAAPRDVSAHVAVTTGGEFDGSDVGIGGRFGWRPWPLLGVEAEATVFPGDYPDGFAFSRARWEAFFGGTFGPRLDRVRPFVRVRPGLLSYREASEPLACIAIFPPPLSCTLAAGATVLAFDVGAGVEVDVTSTGFLRLDVGDRLLRYEGPAFRGGSVGTIDDSFWAHGFRLALGGGVRF